MSIQFLPGPAENAWAFEQLGLPDSATPAEIDATYFRLLATNQFVPYDEVQEAYEILKGGESSHGFLVHQTQLAEQQVEAFAAEIARLKPPQKRQRYDALLKQLPADSRAAARLKAMTSAVIGAYQRFQFADSVKQKLGDACVKALALRPIDRLLLADEMRADKNFIMDRPRLQEAANSLCEKQRGLTDSVGDFLQALFRTDEPIPVYQPPVSQPRRGPRSVVDRAFPVAPRNIPYQEPRQVEKTPLFLRLLVYAAVVFVIVMVGCFGFLAYLDVGPRRRTEFSIPRTPQPNFEYQPYDVDELERTQKLLEELRSPRYEKLTTPPPQYTPPKYTPPEFPGNDSENLSDFEERMRQQNEKLFGPDIDR